MSALSAISLGAPGIYRYAGSPQRSLTGIRLDLCAFAGVAPRGPARVPVVEDESGGRFWRGDVPPVEPERPRLRTVAVEVGSFDEYRRIFGGFEGPGRLPYAVAAYFENGGRRALVARIVHKYGPENPENDLGVARALLLGLKAPVGLNARSEGRWGAAMTAQLDFSTATLDPVWESNGSFRVRDWSGVDAGALVRATFADGTRALRFVSQVVRVPDADRPVARTLAVLDAPLPSEPKRCELVEASLTLDDGDGRTERHANLGLRFGHPRWLAQVLCDESELAWPEHDWAQGQIEPADASLPSPPLAAFDRVPNLKDRWSEIVHEDFFDADWTLGSGEAGSGICAFAGSRDSEGIGASRPASLVVPDLYSHRPLAQTLPIVQVRTTAGAAFSPCATLASSETQATAENDLPGLHLDPVADLAQIVDLQTRVLRFAESLGDLVALLDVPPGLDPDRIGRWRGSLVSSYAAAYHPWLKVARPDDLRDSLEEVPPSAFAAGILAGQELAFGIHHGPANRIAVGALDLVEEVLPASQAALHRSGIDCYVRERDGIRLQGARTLSADPAYRQLSVRRLMIQIRRVLLAQMQWAVFEPNGPALWREVRRLAEGYLRELYRAGAFRGDTEERSFSVACDETLNPPYEQDRGRMVAEIRVAPVEPLEFIVLRLVREGDGTLAMNG
jgi:uncharacterized protein